MRHHRLENKCLRVSYLCFTCGLATGNLCSPIKFSNLHLYTTISWSDIVTYLSLGTPVRMHHRDDEKFWSQSWYKSMLLCLTSWEFIWILYLVIDILLVLLREDCKSSLFCLRPRFLLLSFYFKCRTWTWVHWECHTQLSGGMFLHLQLHLQSINVSIYCCVTYGANSC